jgi:hypothetical protein
MSTTEEQKPYRTETSESGKYKLEVTSVATRPGCWNHTVGVVSRDGQVIAEVKRNYSSFPFLFVENHPNGHDYLVCGADYQGQTVIELDTGKRRDFLPEAAKKGHGFCWVDYSFNTKEQMLIVEGCIWACPYEYRFYDFSNPMEGWLQIEIDGDYVDAEGKSPTFNEDGTVTTYETRSKGELAKKEYTEWTDEDEEKVVVATKTFKIVDRKFVLQSEWVDEDEQRRRAEWKAAQEEYERKWEEYKATDPIFLLVRERAKHPPFEDKPYSLSVGQCYNGWHPTEKFDDSRICKRLRERPRDEKGVMVDEGWTVEVEWGRNSAPVKLEIHKDTKPHTTLWFERSVEGMGQALDYAAKVVTGV